jgi:hypothetical protein
MSCVISEDPPRAILERSGNPEGTCVSCVYSTLLGRSQNVLIAPKGACIMNYQFLMPPKHEPWDKARWFVSGWVSLLVLCLQPICTCLRAPLSEDA